MIMNEDSHVVDIIDYRGKRVILTYKKWKEKATVHPELNNRTFVRNLKQTIENPEQVWEDKSDKIRKMCYYKKYSVNSYVKVVAWIASDPCCVISAFQTDRIKETNYPDTKRLR